jgi:hypothetical protein
MKLKLGQKLKIIREVLFLRDGEKALSIFQRGYAAGIQDEHLKRLKDLRELEIERMRRKTEEVRTGIFEDRLRGWLDYALGAHRPGDYGLEIEIRTTREVLNRKVAR